MIRPWHLHTAVSALRNGGVIAHPTDTVYGLACDPRQPPAIQRLLQLKRRSPQKGLILLAANWQQVLPWLAINSQQQWQALQQADANTERPTTWLLPANPGVPALLRGHHPQLAIRVSQHPNVSYLSQQLGAPLVSSSANLSGRGTCNNSQQLQRQFKGQLDYIWPGHIADSPNPSRIVDFSSGQILRD